MFYTALPLEELTKKQCDGNIIHENLLQINTGDVLLMNRNCFLMKDTVGKSFCFLSKLGSRFDHAGLLMKLEEQELKEYLGSTHKMPFISPSNTYVLEANVKGVVVYALEDRLRRTSAHEVAFSSLALHEDAEVKRQKILSQLPVALQCPYSNGIYSILPCIFSPPDKLDRFQASVLIKMLDSEIRHLSEWVSKKRNHPTLMEDVQHISKLYTNAQSELLELYFPSYSKRGGPTHSQAEMIDLSDSPFAVDGVNHAGKMVCSELICNMWLNAGITTGYLPASSQRPFDFYLSPLRFNFSGPSDRLVSIIPLKVNRFFAHYWQMSRTHSSVSASESSSSSSCICPPSSRSLSSSHDMNHKSSSSSTWEKERFVFMQKVFGSCHYAECSSLEDLVHQVASDAKSSILKGAQEEFLAQSPPAVQLQNVPFRYFCSVVLFSSVQFACAPWTLRWMEAQAGQFIVRGGMWSLASGILLRNLISGAVQSGAMALIFSHYHHVTSSCIILPHSVGPSKLKAFVDTRNPFYSMVSAVWLSSILSWVLTRPIYNSIFYRHFVYRLPGPIPFRHFCCGIFALLPFTMILPYAGFWLHWYETIGSFVFPMRSSVWRPHEELLQEQKKSSWHSKAILSAFGVTLALDATMYSVDTYLKRRSLQRVYSNTYSRRCFGSRRLYAGFRYRFYSTSVQLVVSASVLGWLGLI